MSLYKHAAEIRAIFNHWDDDGSGWLTIEEIYFALNEDEPGAALMMQAFDINGIVV